MMMLLCSLSIIVNHVHMPVYHSVDAAAGMDDNLMESAEDCRNGEMDLVMFL
jgi:hypothetical protein